MEIRVYTLTKGNTLQEFAYDSGSGWYNGGLGSAKFQVAPYSRIAAVFLAGTDALQLRVYSQKLDNTIQEYMWNGLLNRNPPVSCINQQSRRWLEGGHQPWSCSPRYWHRSYLLPLYRLQWPEHPVHDPPRKHCYTHTNL
jgi:hypothetical protein